MNEETVQCWAFPVRKQPTSLCTELTACTSAVVLLVGLNMKGRYGLVWKFVPGTCVSSVCEADVGFGVEDVRSTHGPEWCSVCWLHAYTRTHIQSRGSTTKGHVE